MSNIVLVLGGVTLEDPTIPLLQKSVEGATDITTLSGRQYTDFMFRKRAWEIHFKVLDETEYNALQAIYEAQFSSGNYPNFSFAYYSINNVPVRMHINDKNIQRDGCQLRDVMLNLMEQSAV